MERIILMGVYYVQGDLFLSGAQTLNYSRSFPRNPSWMPCGVRGDPPSPASVNLAATDGYFPIHSQSENVRVTLAQEGREVRLEIQDWGTGFVPESVGTGHFGLEGIQVWALPSSGADPGGIRAMPDG